MALKNMNFFPILGGTCSGTKVFITLTHHARSARALFHLAALTFFASLLIVASGWFRVSAKIDRITEFLQEKCGGLEIGQNGIRPVIEPEKAKYYLVTPDLEFNYTPNVKVTAEDIGQNKDAKMGIIWSPGIVAMWFRNEKQYVFAPLIKPEGEYKGTLLEFLSKSALAEKLTKFGKPEGPFNIKLKKININEKYKLGIVFYASAILFGAYYLYIAFQGLFFGLIFSCIFGFTGRRNLRSLPFNRLFAIVLYASFPPIIVATLFPALDLAIDFQTVFLFCYVCYLMSVLMRVERTLDADAEQ